MADKSWRSRRFRRAVVAAWLFGLTMEGASAMADPAGLAGEWRVRSASGPGSAAVNAAKPKAVVFADDQVRVRGACNLLFGTVAVEEARLVFGSGLASTKMACPKDQMDSDRFVLDVLQDSADYSVADGVARIVNGEQILVLERAAGSDEDSGN